MSRMSHIELSEGDATLTFCPHLRGGTATFDIVTSNPRSVAHDVHLPPEYERSGVSICSNIDRAAARELRDALDAWLRRLS